MDRPPATTRTEAGPRVVGEPQPFATDREFRQFTDFVSRHTGIALTEGKQQLVCSRLRKRLRHYGYVSLAQYYEHLTARDPRGEELVHMVNALTTNRTEFFREAHHFHLLRAELAARGSAVPGRRRLRIWSAGCSSGEEAYSLAFTVLDAVPDVAAWNVKILASDIDTNVLSRAETAIYPVERVMGVPWPVRERYFAYGRGAHAGLVRVRAAARDLVVFRRINLRQEPWPIRTTFDVIFCRNVLIYFDRALQQRLIARFVEHLEPGGLLFLGHAESLLGMRTGLRYRGRTVYQKIAEGASR